MARKKIGRNDSCPCGSGKKYKRCCLRKDAGSANHGRTSRAHAPRKRDREVRRLMRGWPPQVALSVLGMLDARDLDSILETFEDLHDLLAEGGPLAHLRFDEILLERAVQQAIDSGLDPLTDQSAALFDACAPSIGTPALVQALVRDATALVAAAELPGPLLEAAGIAALTTALVSQDSYASMPALEIVFRVQLSEIHEWRKLFAAMDSAVARAEPASETLSETASRVMAENPALIEKINSSKMLYRIVERQAEAAVERANQLVEE